MIRIGLSSPDLDLAAPGPDIASSATNRFFCFLDPVNFVNFRA